MAYIKIKMKVTNNITDIVNDLNNGKIVCFKTDTIWGLSANPFDKHAIEELYRIKKRDMSKPFIFLIKQNEVLENYINVLKEEKIITKKVWPGPVSIIFNYNNNSNLLSFYSENKTIALRMPKNNTCQKILQLITYPLPSTSVNIEGATPLDTFEEVKNFLKNEDVTILKSVSKPKNKSSLLIKLDNGKITVLRNNTTKKILEKLI